MVVFFDIDGTIVDNATQCIPPSAIRAVERLRENGHCPVVNTGRPYAHIDPRVKEMAFSGWVCGCGMEIFLNGEVLHRAEPSSELCRLVRDTVRDCGMQALYEPAEGAVYLDGENSVHPDIHLECSRMTAKGFSLRQLDEANPRFLKLVTFDWENCRREEFIRRMEPHFTCIHRENTMLELVLKGCSKAAGMELLLSALGIPREDTLAIGDSTNDLPMFAAAKHKVCMANGMEELKSQADFVTDTVLNDGIEKALRHYKLI